MKTKTLAAIAALASAGMFAVSPAVADYGGQWQHANMTGGMGWLGMFIGPVMWLVWIALALTLVMLILRLFGVGRVRSDTTTAQTSPSATEALDILRRRFAEGEIDAKAFDSMKARLAKE